MQINEKFEKSRFEGFPVLKSTQEKKFGQKQFLIFFESFF